MKIIKYINLKFSEMLVLAFIYLILVVNFLVFKDSIAAVFSAFFGITYTFLAGKGNPICYLFGLTGSSFYGYLAFYNAFWGNLILYIGYYIPMQVLGFFRWNKHLKSDRNEVVKICLTTKERFLLLGVTILATVFAVIILYYLKDKNPIIDGITTVFSVLGMYLTVRRAIEQWLVWIVVNGLSAFMWILIALEGAKVYSTVIMWCVYFCLAIYFYISWKNEISNNQELHQRDR